MSVADAAPDGAASQSTSVPNLQNGSGNMDKDVDQMETTDTESRTRKEPTRVFVNYQYKSGDSRPFRVMVENTDIEKRRTINRLKVGAMLHQNGFDKSIEDICKTGRQKVTVYVGNWKDANRLASSQNLQLQGYKAYVPKQFVTVTGVISGIPPDMDEQDIKMNIRSRVEIDSIFRLHRFIEKKKEPTYKIGVVFRSNVLPTDINIFSVIFRVQPYIRKPVICYKCLRYNHVSKNCKSKTGKCASCAEEHPVDITCKTVKCFYCESNDHRTTDKTCPRWKKESNIQATMAKNGMTYQEAKHTYIFPTENQFDVLRSTEEYPTPAESYSYVARRAPRSYQKENLQRNNINTNNRFTKGKERREEEGELMPEVAKELVKKRKMEEDREESRGTGLNNPYRTEEAEKIRKQIEETIKKQTQTEWRKAMKEVSTRLVEILKPHGAPGEELTNQIMGELMKAGEWTGNSS